MKIIISILSYDIWFYISHILLHKSLYKYHHEHHTNLAPTYLDTYVGHVLEGPFQGVGMFLPCIIWTYSYYELFIILLLLDRWAFQTGTFYFQIGLRHKGQVKGI
jgi:sterol desaturase/sphingolipid hydroxylase (fatty acid hydroxylase superfamily)